MDYLHFGRICKTTLALVAALAFGLGLADNAKRTGFVAIVSDGDAIRQVVFDSKETPEEIVFKHDSAHGFPASLSISRDLSMITFASDRSPVIYSSSVPEGTEMWKIDYTTHILDGQSIWVQGFSFSPDGTMFAALVGLSKKNGEVDSQKVTQEFSLYDSKGNYLRSLDFADHVVAGSLVNLSWNADSTQVLLTSQRTPDAHRELKPDGASRGILVEVANMKWVYLPIADARFVDARRFIGVSFLKSKSTVSLMEVNDGELKSLRNYNHSAPLWSDPISGQYLVEPAFLFRAPAPKLKYVLYANPDSPRILGSVHLRKPRPTVVLANPLVLNEN